MGEKKIAIILKGAKRQISLKALLDSGATVSVVSKKIADKIGMENYGVGRGEDIQGKSVNGINSVAKVKIAGGWIAADFVILPSVPDKVILGVDFIQKADIKIDWKNETINTPKIYKRKRFRI